MRVRGRLKNIAKKKVNEKVKIDRKGKQKCSEQSCKATRRIKEEEHRGQGNKCRCDSSEEDVDVRKRKKGEERGKKRDGEGKEGEISRVK